ncbi:hypothetical protein [Rhodococcus daqingensis]|uniref:Condensation domain-containing protein n=1 Tax=Rhodococcus daqingensis TaxID=2479363 RepID=A0ABW2RRN6_9NOCA
MSGSSRRYRPTALDRALAGSRVVSVIGPVRDLRAEDVRAALSRLVHTAPDGRVALNPDPNAAEWEYRPDLVEHAVAEVAPVGPDGIAGLLTEVRNRPGPRLPVEITVSGDYIVVDVSHALGDGLLIVLILTALANGPDTGGMDALAARALPADGLRSGLWRHFRADPRRLRQVLRLRARHRALDGTPEEPIELGEWESTKRAVISRMPGEQIAALRAWGKEHEPGATTASLSAALYATALRDEGIECDDRMFVLMDCRRYLPEQQRLRNGNFAVGISLRFDARPQPRAIAEAVREVTESGWPIAAMGIGEVKSALRRPRSAAGAPVVTAQRRVRLAVSDMGRPAALEAVRWSDDGRPPVVIPYIDPDGPDAMTLCVLEVGGGRVVSASFHDSVIDRGRVQAALDRASADPVAVLSGAGRADAG